MLAALEAQTRRLDRLVVVDNAPSDRAQAQVAAIPGAEYVAAPENLGPAGGIAGGMTRLLPDLDDGDWIVTLDDDDPPVEPDLFATLLAYAVARSADDPAVGAVGADGVRCDLRRGRMVWVPDAELAGDVEVDWIGGDFFPVYSVRALRRAGPMRADLFFGFEELELGLRLGAHGFRLLVPGELGLRTRAAAGQLGFTVVPSRSLAPLTWRRYYSIRNLVRILVDRRAYGAAVRVTVVVGLGKPLVNLPRTPRVAWAHLRCGARAGFDAWTGRLGRTVEPIR